MTDADVGPLLRPEPGGGLAGLQLNPTPRTTSKHLPRVRSLHGILYLFEPKRVKSPILLNLKKRLMREIGLASRRRRIFMARATVCSVFLGASKQDFLLFSDQ